MDKPFDTTKKPSQWIFSNVLTGSDITLTDVDGLETFARLCDEALCFMETSPGTFLSFNEQMTQERIFERLDPELSRKWFEYRVERRLPEGAVSFKVFSEWINAQSSIELARIGSDRKDRRSQTSLTTQKEKTETAYQPPHARGISRVETPPRSRTVNAKDFPPRCGGCRDPSHVTFYCPKLNKLSPEEQWKNFNTGICRHCLDSQHPHGSFWNCPLRGGEESCPDCRNGDFSHHAKMKCNPERRRAYGSKFGRQQ